MPTYNIKLKTTDTIGAFSTKNVTATVSYAQDKVNYLFLKQGPAATGGTIVYTSKDSITWNNYTITPGTTNESYWYRPEYGGGKWMILRMDLADPISGSPQVYRLSSDGLNWTEYSFPERVAKCQYPVWVKDRWAFIGSTSKKIYWSIDGISWTASSIRVQVNDAIFGDSALPTGAQHFYFSKDGTILLQSNQKPTAAGGNMAGTGITFVYINWTRDFGETWEYYQLAAAGGAVYRYPLAVLGNTWVSPYSASTATTFNSTRYYNFLVSPYAASAVSAISPALAFAETPMINWYEFNGKIFVAPYVKAATTGTNPTGISCAYISLGTTGLTNTAILNGINFGVSPGELKTASYTSTTNNYLFGVIFSSRQDTIFACPVFGRDTTTVSNGQAIKYSSDGGNTWFDITAISGSNGLPSTTANWKGLMGMACAND